MGRIINWGMRGVYPKLMGRVRYARRRLRCQRAGLTLDIHRLIEVNEAFARSISRVEKELGLDREKVNFNGGSDCVRTSLGSDWDALVITLLV